MNVGISAEFISEVGVIKRINDSFRKMDWKISLKEEEYNDWGEEILNRDYHPNLKLFDLNLVDEGNEIAGKDNQISALPELLTSNKFTRIRVDIEEDIISDILKDRCEDVDDETDADDYMTKKEQSDVRIKATYLAIKKIAEKIIYKIRTHYKLNNSDIVRVYYKNTLLIAETENDSGFTEEKKKAVLDLI